MANKFRENITTEEENVNTTVVEESITELPAKPVKSRKKGVLAKRLMF